MPMEREEKCLECHYWEPIDSKDTGECRFNPPTLTVKGRATNCWPKTNGEDWCGQFKKTPPIPLVVDGNIYGAKSKG